MTTKTHISQSKHKQNSADDQTPEAAAELVGDARTFDDEADGFTPGQDNIIIDKTDNQQMTNGIVLAELRRIAALIRPGYVQDVVIACMNKVGRLGE